MTTVFTLLSLALVAVAATFFVRIEIRRKKIWWAVFFILLLTGALLVDLNLSIVETLFKIKRWPTAEAKILSSEVTGQRAFHPEVVLEYAVNGQVYTFTTDMDVPGFGTKSNRLNVARQTVIENFPGKILTIHYNPENPGDAVLHTSGKFSTYVFLSIGVMMYTAGVFGILLTLRRRGIEKSG